MVLLCCIIFGKFQSELSVSEARAIITISKELKTKGDGDCHNITPEVEQAVRDSGVRSGLVNIFIPGSTAALTTLEFEEGVIKDLAGAMERLIPKNIPYQHDERWQDRNGYSHVRAALMGPSLTVPFVNGGLQLGRWQQIVLIDFDNRSRNRQYLINILGGDRHP
ncbi:MAG TPA: secondary thiamine-phosphate synthase enzyme YjbQ [Candidatus Brocadiales bacterium]|nr:secondary thiamine-phosphate synthase enzyme YjbQ [Candidatus Brocadiales bacterium]